MHDDRAPGLKKAQGVVHIPYHLLSVMQSIDEDQVKGPAIIHKELIGSHPMSGEFGGRVDPGAVRGFNPGETLKGLGKMMVSFGDYNSAPKAYMVRDYHLHAPYLLRFQGRTCTDIALSGNSKDRSDQEPKWVLLVLSQQSSPNPLFHL